MQQVVAPNPTRWATLRSVPVQLLVVGSLYYVSAELGLLLSLVGDSVTPLWPPTGVALVAMLVFGRRMWPAGRGCRLRCERPGECQRRSGRA